MAKLCLKSNHGRVKSIMILRSDRDLDIGPDVITDVGLNTKKPVTWKVYSRRKKVGPGREIDNEKGNQLLVEGRGIDKGSGRKTNKQGGSGRKGN